MGVQILILALVVGADPATAPQGPPTGSAPAGRELFIGVRPLSAGGPPCGACHALAGEGLAFSGSLGPELSSGLKDMDPAALDGLLESLPFPTMMPLYDGHALTVAERADLVAFLVPAAQRGPPRPEGRLAVPVILLTGALMAAVALLSRRRKAPTRARLLARAVRRPGESR